MTDLEIKEFLDTCYASFVRKLSRTITLFYDDKLANLNITYQQLFTLLAITAYGPYSKRDFCKKTGSDRTTLARNLDLMKKSGLINIIREQKGSKTYLISKNYLITERGKKLMEEGYKIWKDNHHKLEKSVLTSPYIDHDDLSSIKYTCNEFVIALQGKL
jgi:DNA-binding MarR family transcriptional regulator